MKNSMAAKEHNHEIQRAKAEGLRMAYERLLKELDEHMISWITQLENDNAEQRKQIIIRWQIMVDVMYILKKKKINL